MVKKPAWVEYPDESHTGKSHAPGASPDSYSPNLYDNETNIMSGQAVLSEMSDEDLVREGAARAGIKTDDSKDREKAEASAEVLLTVWHVRSRLRRMCGTSGMRSSNPRSRTPRRR